MLVRLHLVEVRTLALREAVLAVELELGNLHRVLAVAADIRINEELRENVVGLDASVTRLGGIIGVVREVAEQTNRHVPVIGVVERLLTVERRIGITSRRAVHERIALHDPEELLHGVIEVELDLVRRRRDRLRARVLHLLN